ncbi:MAG: class I SAM-dependent methyltransferase [Hydrococcus sp. Prado102]|jgi:malonyl-CoA O-methyltransferase|nr:class I SAM-dependent methyltransferase [Hydrococcus sp. Prado102]
MSIQEAYDRWSNTYDTDINLTRDLDRLVTENTLSNLKFRSILELGCGTGKNTLLLSKIAQTVHAMDFSASMIEKAQKKLKSTDNVTFSSSNITEPWDCRDRSIDLVVCNLVLEHIENLSSIFFEAYRCLVESGKFFICELHPFRQYQGTKANFYTETEKVEIPAFVHHISDFFEAGKSCGFTFKEFKEWWHPQDQNKVPRLVSFVFEK